MNNLFENTVPSRLFDPAVDKIIIIMQRTHDDYRNKGISDEVAKELISAGYDQYETSDKIGGVEIPGLQEYLKSKKYTAVKDKYGAVKIIGKSGNIIPQEVISNPSNPLYGTYWNTETG